MSSGPRVILGIVALFSGACFLFLGATLDPMAPKGQWAYYATGAFCGVIGVACLSRRSRPVTLRVIGAAIFLGFAAFAATSLGGDKGVRPLLGFVVLGLPAGYLAATGKYPTWGRFSAAFNPRDRDGNM